MIGQRTPAEAAADAIEISARVLARRVKAGDRKVANQIAALHTLLDTLADKLTIEWNESDTDEPSSSG